MLLDEKELEDDAIQCEDIEYNTRQAIQKISKELQSIKINDNVSNVLAQYLSRHKEWNYQNLI